MMRSAIAVATALAAAAVSWVDAARGQEPQQERPIFRASTDLVLIDAHVVARDGTPIQGLTAEQFEVFIDGRRRPVLSADFVRSGAPISAVVEDAARAAAPENREGRIIVLAIDQGSFPVSAQASAREAATRVLDRVASDDYLGLIAFPGPVQISPTRDRSLVREGIARISGLRTELSRTSRFNISASEAVQLKGRTSIVTKEVIERECRGWPPIDQLCPQEVMEDGSTIATALEQQTMLSLDGLHGVLDAMASLPGRKTLIVVSAGLPMSNLPGSRLNFDAETTRVARRAAAANVNLYVFYLNVHFLRFFSPEYGKRNNAIYDDISMFGAGLERFADSGGGAFFQVEVDSDPFVDRALRETSASYLLAVRAEPAERDGKEHFIRVSVKARGATVRYRRVVTIPGGG